MLLTGTFQRSLDSKLRFTLPKKVRAGFDQLVYITPGTDVSLCLYPADVFDGLARQLSQAPSTGQDVRTFQRLFFAQAECQELDAQARVRIPTALATLAELTKEVVLLGVRDHVELWDRVRWEQYLAEQQPRYDLVAERVLESCPYTPGNTAPQE